MQEESGQGKVKNDMGMGMSYMGKEMHRKEKDKGMEMEGDKTDKKGMHSPSFQEKRTENIKENREVDEEREGNGKCRGEGKKAQ